MRKLTFLGQTIPAVGLGTWYMGEGLKPYEQELQAIRYGIEGGIRLIDTAEMYGDGLAEKLVGEAIKPYERERISIVTKVYPWNATKTGTEKALEASLKRLNTEYVDLYLLHWREDVPLHHSIEALMELKDRGKIKEWGVSNFDVTDLEELKLISNDCVANQVMYHLGSRGIEFALKPKMDEENMTLMAYSPLGHGDKYATNFSRNTVLHQIAREHNASIQQILLAFATRLNNTIAIPKASSIEHVEANIHSLNIHLTEEQIAALNVAYPAPKDKIPLDEL